jgi:hypothetical protein
MRIDSNKFHLVRLEVDIFAMKCPAGTPRTLTGCPRRDHQRLQPTARTTVFGTALDRLDPFTYTRTRTVDAIPQ